MSAMGIRQLLTKGFLLAKSNPFDKLDLNSISTMDKVLGILNSTNAKTPRDNERVLLGKQIFEYRLVRYLNERHIVASDSRIWTDTRAKYRDFVRDSMEDYNTWTKCYHNENYLKIMEFFLANDLGCVQSLESVISKMINLKPKKVNYGFPKLKIPAAFNYQVDNKFLLPGNPANSLEDTLYILPYIINDPLVVERVIHRHQSRKKIPRTPYSMVTSLMESQEYEGEMLFSILVKSNMFKDKSLQNDFIREKFLTQSHKLKAIVCHQSLLLSRLSSFNEYKACLPNIRVGNPSKLMVNQFDRYIALMFRIKRQKLLNWLYALMHYYNNNRSAFNDDKLYDDAIMYIKELVQLEMPKINLR